MAEMLYQLIGSLSYYLQGFSTIPGGFSRRISIPRGVSVLVQSRTESAKDGPADHQNGNGD